jgi:Transposase DDE domain
MVGSHEKWGIFKCHKWGELLRHSQAETTRKVGGEMTQKMRQKLKRAGYRSRYRLRKQIVEPVFGQIKQARGFRQFLLRGLEAVQAEWALICTTHNITKLAKAV